MELNEIHTDHEEATTSLKVVLLVFAVVLVGALAYLVWNQNTTTDTTDNSTLSVKENMADTATVAGKTTYTDNQEGFSITYPDTWKLTKRDIDAAYETSYYDGDTAETLARPESVRDFAWGITVTKNSTITEMVAAQRESAQSRIAVKATNLQDSSVRVGTETATIFSYQQDTAKTMLYFFAKGNRVFEITTDGSTEQMVVAETFKFTK